MPKVWTNGDSCYQTQHYPAVKEPLEGLKKNNHWLAEVDWSLLAVSSIFGLLDWIAWLIKCRIFSANFEWAESANRWEMISDYPNLLSCILAIKSPFFNNLASSKEIIPKTLWSWVSLEGSTWKRVSEEYWMGWIIKLHFSGNPISSKDLYRNCWPKRTPSKDMCSMGVLWSRKTWISWPEILLMTLLSLGSLLKNPRRRSLSNQ